MILAQTAHARRKFGSIARNGQRLETAGLAADQAHRRFGHSKRLGQKRSHSRIGAALVRHGSDPHTQHHGPVIAGLGAIDRVAPGIGRDAQMQKKTAACQPVEARFQREPPPDKCNIR